LDFTNPTLSGLRNPPLRTARHVEEWHFPNASVPNSRGEAAALSRSVIINFTHPLVSNGLIKPSRNPVYALRHSYIKTHADPINVLEARSWTRTILAAQRHSAVGLPVISFGIPAESDHSLAWGVSAQNRRHTDT